MIKYMIPKRISDGHKVYIGSSEWNDIECTMFESLDTCGVNSLYGLMYGCIYHDWEALAESDDDDDAPEFCYLSELLYECQFVSDMSEMIRTYGDRLEGNITIYIENEEVRF